MPFAFCEMQQSKKQKAYLHNSGIYWAANEESLQTKKILAKKILCKEKDAKKAKKNIGNKTLILHFF